MIEIRSSANPANVVKVYADTFEQEAYDQVKKLVDYPAYNASKIRIMPDAHAGKGCTIGTTMVVGGAVTPNLVGVDIGCGMLVIDLGADSSFSSEETLTKLDEMIHLHVPAGFETHDHPVEHCDGIGDLLCKNSCNLERAAKSVGSLGGGNHFIELDYSENIKHYYLVIHTGSRNLGTQVCKFYQDLAFKCLDDASAIKKQVSDEIIARCKAEGRGECISNELKRAFESMPKPSASRELAHLTGSNFQNYIHDMEIVQKYAALNRSAIAKIIIQKMKWGEESRFDTIHNYIDIKGMVLRKGAVSAQKGEKLVIPMNMRDGSLICIGKGNPDWNWSAPHGAGRLMSRSKAREAIGIDEYKDSMKGIYTTSVSAATVDESPMVYKPAEEIMRCIEPTASIVDVIRPVYNFKAGEE